MFWVIFGMLILLWLLGFLANIGGGLIHVLLIAAAVVLIINLLTDRRSVV